MTEQIDTLLEHIKDYYQQLATYYQGLAVDSGQSDRVALIADHVKDYECKRVAMLDEQLREHPDYPDFLATWLKEKPHEPNSALHLQLEDPTPETCEYRVDDIVLLVSKQHNQIASIYRQLAELTHTESLQEFFSSLARNEETELKLLVNSMQEFKSL